MGVKISNLPAVVTPSMSDIFPIVQSGVTYKESFTQLSSLFATAGANSNITSLSGLTTPLSVPQGGTGIATATAYGVLTGGSSATAAFQVVTPGTAGKLLQSGGASALPSWTTATFPIGSGTLNHMIRSDGTNWVQTTAMTLDASDNMAGVTSAAIGNMSFATNTITSTNPMTISTGASGALSLVSANQNLFFNINSTDVAGFPGILFNRNTSTLIGDIEAGVNDAFNAAGNGFFIYNPVGKIFLRDSTGNALGISAGVVTLSNALLPASGGLGTAVAPSAGQIPIGTSGNVYTPAAINSGTGIVVANGSGSITVSATGSGMAWTTTAGTTQAVAVDNGYISGNAAQSTFTLPATAAIGATAAVEGLGAGGWILAANTGQTIKVGTGTTSSAGSLTSAAASDNVYVTCIVANTTWRVRSTNSTGLTIA